MNNIDPLQLPSVLLGEKLPNCSCVYFAIDSSDRILYIGRTKNLHKRWKGHQHISELKKIERVRIAYFECSVDNLDYLEKTMIVQFNPPLNQDFPVSADYYTANSISLLHEKRKQKAEALLFRKSNQEVKLISRLPELMEQAGIDQKTLAFETGLSPTTVSKFYRCHFDRIDINTAETLCKYFNLQSVSQLIEIEWEENDSQSQHSYSSS